MTIADALSDYARECQHDRLRSFLRFNVLNSTNDNPTAPSPPSLSGATGGGSVFNNAAPNPVHDVCRQLPDGNGSAASGSFSFHSGDNTDA